MASEYRILAGTGFGRVAHDALGHGLEGCIMLLGKFVETGKRVVGILPLLAILLASAQADARVVQVASITGPTVSSGTYILSWKPGIAPQTEAVLEERRRGADTWTPHFPRGNEWKFTRPDDGIYEHRLQYCPLDVISALPAQQDLSRAAPTARQAPPLQALPAPQVSPVSECSPWSKIHTVTVEHPPSIPGSLGPDVTDTDGSYTLSWGPSSGKVTRYVLRERSSEGSAFSRVYQGAELSYTVYDKPTGIYEYRVQACNRFCSSLTGPKFVKVEPLPRPPTPLALPEPAVTVQEPEGYETGGVAYLRYRLPVSNWQSYPAELFAPAPDLPPCGANANASRAWVYIRDADSDRALKSYCALRSPADLAQGMSAGVRKDAAERPERVYLQIVDRRTGGTYRSAAVPLPQPPAPGRCEALTSARFTWSMPPRYGPDALDRNKNGLVDMPNTLDYVMNRGADGCSGNAAAFKVKLEPSGVRSAPVSGEPLSRGGESYEWTIEGGGLIAPITRKTSSEEAVSVCLPEGSYNVTLLHRVGSCEAQTSANVTVEDILIVALGDSYASGEGVPERRIEPGPIFRSGGRTKNSEDLRKWAVATGSSLPVWADDGAREEIHPQEVAVVDLLVGKFGTGEVNAPDARQFARERVEHYKAHRSSFAATSQAAIAIEQADPHTSVTYVNFAMSGATIREGLLGPKKGLKTPGATLSAEPMTEQISRLVDVVKGREIDALTLGIGGNDVGFATIIAALVIRDGPPGDTKLGPTFGEIEDAFRTGEWDRIENKIEDNHSLYSFFSDLFNSMQDISWSSVVGLNDLQYWFEAFSRTLHERLNQNDIHVRRIYLTGYPDLSQARHTGCSRRGRNARNSECQPPQIDCSMLGRLVSESQVLHRRTRLEIKPFEAKWAREHILRPLNERLAEIAADLSRGEDHWVEWQFVPAPDDFKDHGVCGARPYNFEVMSSYQPSHPVTETRARWFRNAKESMTIQGPPNIKKTTGTVHPNEFGHRALSLSLIAAMKRADPKIAAALR